VARRRPRSKRRKKGLIGNATLALRRNDWRLAKLFAAIGALLTVVLIWSVWPYWQLSQRFEPLPSAQPSRLFGRPFVVAGGARLSAETLVSRLQALAYRRAGGEGLVPGTFRLSGDRVSVARRRFRTASGADGGGLMVAEFSGGRLSALSVGRRPVAEALLDPPLLATFYGPDLLDRRPTPISSIPGDVVRAVLAAEDASFFEHPGISASGILRAVWTNLRAGGVRQGGSTITQQLAKNLYLTHERRVTRKMREALLAVMLEWRYSKEEILEAYLNQIFWGRSGSANVIGIGAASWAYFERPPGELTLAEGALLAGMIPAPADYSPAKNPQGAKQRRQRVLERMADLGWVGTEEATAAMNEPMPEPAAPLSSRRAPYYVDAVALEVRARWGIADLADIGLEIHGTLDPVDQAHAERVVEEGLVELTGSNERVRKKADLLQAALVSLEPSTGAVRAYVGGRDYRKSQFDRAGQARRQAGSAFKPFVYAAAFEAGTATPATLLEDAPLSIESGGELWSPANDDDEYRGWVTARTAIEKSLNLPTVRLALQTGLEQVVATARAAGVSTRLRPFPSVALGAFEVSPLDLATAYASFANRGVRPQTHLVEAVIGADGDRLPGEPLRTPRAAVSPETAYLITALLQGVVDYGTAVQARALGLTDPVAGKTGTSNRRRDNWFAGYAPERATLVWVGFDDDSPTPFSGSRAALPIWVRFMLAVRPPGGFSRPPAPAGVRVVLVDPRTGELATDRCPEVLAEAFRADRIPGVVCHLHGGWSAQPIDPGIRAERDEKRGTLRDWLRKLFSRDQDDRRDRRRTPSTGPPP
jgi:penicillin-binding protein 1B